MKNWEERFDKKFEGELWLGKYIDVDENGNQYVHRLELKDFIRRLLEEQEKHLIGYFENMRDGAGDVCMNTEGADKGACDEANFNQEIINRLSDYYKQYPATDKLQIIK